MITLCAATETEIAPALDYIRKHKSAVGYFITGVGLLPASFAIATYWQKHKTDTIIQAGLAGSLNSGLLPGTTVIVKSEMVGDAGVEENGKFRSLFDLKLAADKDPWTSERLVNPNVNLLEGSGLQQVSGVTVNEISTSNDRISYYRNQLGCDIENMEGAALHYAGISLRRKFIQIRTISNLIGERDKTKWKLSEAIDNLNLEIIKMIQTENK